MVPGTNSIGGLLAHIYATLTSPAPTAQFSCADGEITLHITNSYQYPVRVRWIRFRDVNNRRQKVRPSAHDPIDPGGHGIVIFNVMPTDRLPRLNRRIRVSYRRRMAQLTYAEPRDSNLIV